MATFYSDINVFINISEWVNIIDWIFEDKFQGENWSSGYVGQFIKRVKKLNGISKNNYNYESACKIIFPNGRSRKRILIQLGNGNGESRDLLRHIRNAVAHNNASIFNRQGNYYFQFIDFASDKKTQTAYILFPIEYLKTIYDIYKDVEQKVKN